MNSEANDVVLVVIRNQEHFSKTSVYCNLSHFQWNREVVIVENTD